VKGDIVVVNFPFTNRLDSKRRPALVVANSIDEDLILSIITSIQRSEKYSIEIDENDFLKNNLKLKSYVRINKLFTIDKNLILYKTSALKKEKIKEIEKKIVEMFLE
jgi:mRNA interferase MazF